MATGRFLDGWSEWWIRNQHGFGWTESGTAAKNPNPTKETKQREEPNDTSIDGIEMIVKSITTEIEKMGKVAKKKVGKVKKQFKKKFGLWWIEYFC